MIARSLGLPGLLPDAWEVAAVTGLFAVALACVCAAASI